jgi:transglutaminase-like putative cysteine protease
MAVNGYHETVVSERFSFNVPPDSAQDLTVDGMPIRRFTWDAPPADTTIKVVVKRTFSVDAGLTRFHSAASYPLASVPDDVKPYLQVTHSLQLTASQRAFVRHLVGKQSRERAVVTKVANWVASSMRYDASLVAGPYDASWVLANRRGTCQGYASVMAGMLRALGIPSQVVYGWVSSRPLTVRSGSNFETISWAQPGTPGAFHDWLNVYFPGKGWVAFDPQREKFFVDTRHYALLTEVDATDPGMGGWTAYPVGDQSITGRTLSFGGTEAVPESGIIPPQVAERDTLRVHIAAVVHDVRAVTLLSR